MKRLLALRFVAMAEAGRFLQWAGGRIAAWGAELTFAVEARRDGRRTLREIRADRKPGHGDRPLTGKPKPGR